MLMVSTTPTGRRMGDDTHYIILNSLWSGKHEGKLTEERRVQCLQAYLDVATPLPAPFHGFTAVMPLSMAHKKLTTAHDYDENRFHVNALTLVGASLETNFFERLATQIDRDIASPDVNFIAISLATVFDTMVPTDIEDVIERSAYPLRSMTAHLNHWVYFSKDTPDNNIVENMLGFRKDTASHQHPVTHSFMSTDTTAGDTVTLKTQWAQYFPSRAWYDRLRRVKRFVDPGNLFRGQLTIPVN
jgi:hypothetical protein